MKDCVSCSSGESAALTAIACMKGIGWAQSTAVSIGANKTLSLLVAFRAGLHLAPVMVCVLS